MLTRKIVYTGNVAGDAEWHMPTNRKFIHEKAMSVLQSKLKSS